MSNRPSHYLGGNRSMVLTERGDRMIVDTRDMMIAPGLLCWGSWEPDTAAALDKYLKAGMRWIDIGANIGYFTVIGSKLVGPSGFSYAFEANPRTHALLVDNMNLNWIWQGIRIENKAVFQEAKTLRFVAPVKYAVNGTIADVNESSWSSANDEVEFFDVEAVRLDDYLPVDEKIDLIKIDIEGSELGALRGARKTLNRLRDVKIMLEWSPDQMVQCGFDKVDLINEIKDLGFKITVMEGRDETISFEEVLGITATTMLLLDRQT